MIGRCLITGGTGFLGLRTAELLSEAGHEVILADVRGRADDRWPVLSVDITSAADVFAAVGETRPDYVIHLASLLPPNSEASLSRAEAVILHGFAVVLEAARIFSTRRVVWASATSVFGEPAYHGGLEVSVRNDAPHYPTTIYGIFKSACERLGQLYWSRHGIDTIGLRFAQGYGPRKARGRPFGYELFEAAAAGGRYSVPYGDDLVNWQYVDDIADLLVRALALPPTETRVFNTSGEVISMRETVRLLRELAPECELTLEPGVTGLAWRYDTALLERDFGPVSITPAHVGFARTIDQLRAGETHQGAVVTR